MKVVFLHPDLGIGGAERLVVDAALALKTTGHEVCFVTAHHDADHCFVETRDGTLSVTAVGDWLPRSLAGYCYALCAYLRMIYAAVYLVFCSGLHPDVVFCDQISVCTPVLRLGGFRIVFYCHFPDQLLTKRESFLKKLYRAPLDWLEKWTTGLAQRILVNSEFTAAVFHDTFGSLEICPEVLYPSLNFSCFDKIISLKLNDILKKDLPHDTFFLLSINRYERKKNLKLALETLSNVRQEISDDNWCHLHLIMAGGYDERVVENVDHYQELVMAATEMGVTSQITFLKSPSDASKLALLHQSDCLLYTPENEHFGIVPLEAMYMGTPVVAVRSGGPTETIMDGSTGYLCEPEPNDFAKAVIKLLTDKKLRENMGQAGRKWVRKKFSFEAFTNQLNDVVEGMVTEKKEN